MHSTAGLFGGDVTDCTIHVESGARVLITQQSATKVHPSGGRSAIQRNQIHVDADGELQFLLDPVIPFSEARVCLTTSIDVAPGARLRFWEGLMAGRIGRGEFWRFEEFSSETSLRLNGRPLFLDRFRLRPAEYSPDTPWTMKNAAYVGTGLYFDERAAEFAERLHALLPDANVGVDFLEPGLAVTRMVAVQGPEFHRYRSIFAS
jgi:urease accessory protein